MAVKQNEKLKRKTDNVAPHNLVLLITTVNRNKAEYYADLIQSFEVNLQMDTMATAKVVDSGMLQYLGLTATDKTVIFSFVRDNKVNELMDVLEEKFHSIKNGKGVAVAVPLSSMIGKLIYGFLSNNERVIQEEKKNGK